MERKEHWNTVYAEKNTDEVSWYQDHPRLSLELIHRSGIEDTAAIIDVGAGASILVDDLLAEGYSDLTVLDISPAALQEAQTRLGDASPRVQWLEADILETELPENGYELWHDRAVFHFLTSPRDRRAYADAVRHAVKPGGFLIVATFAEDGPTECSGLPVMRYRPEELQAEFGDAFALVDQAREEHQTPAGRIQSFVYCLFRMTAAH